VALADWNPLDPNVLEEPWEYYSALRREAPVYRCPRTGFVMVSTYDLALEVVRDHERFSNRFGRVLAGGRTPSAEVQRVAAEGWPPVDTMLTADEPEHRRFRGLVNKAFTARRVNGLEPAIEQISRDLIDGFAGAGRFEVLSQYSVLLPLTVIADQLGVPRCDLEKFKRWTDGFTAQLSGFAGAEGEVEAAKRILEFQRYFAERLEEARRAPREDVISDLGRARLEGERPLDTAECLSILQQLLVAGNETTASAIAEGLLLLVRHPDQLALVRADPGLVPNLVDEVLRLSTPTACMFRVATRDTELAGVPIAKDNLLLVRFASANRDERVFTDPDRFDVRRANADEHLAFGQGIHFCIGAPLARKEMTVAFRQLLARTDGLRLAPGAPAPRHKPSILLRGLAELWLEFEGRERAVA
jgi:cytochrome P450